MMKLLKAFFTKKNCKKTKNTSDEYTIEKILKTNKNICQMEELQFIV